MMKLLKRNSSFNELDLHAEKINTFAIVPSRWNSESSLTRKDLLLQTHDVCFKLHEEYQRKCTNYRGLILANNSTIKWMKESEQKICLELEKVRRDISVANKEKELAVVQYAVAEKNLIDVRNQRKDFETRNAKMKREIEQLNLKIKSQVHENDMVRRMVDDKCAELRGAQREIQRMKTDVVELETKMKWNTVKLKQEIGSRMEAEKKVVALQDENNRLKQNQAVLDENAASPKITDKAIVEMEAKLILYKHTSEEKQKLISNLEEQIENLKETNLRLNGLPEQLMTLQQQHNDLQTQYQSKDNQILELNSRIIELEFKLQELEASQQELIEANANAKKEIEDLQNLNIDMEDVRKEITQLHEEDEHIRQINKDLAQKTVEMQNELVMTQHKSTAIITENSKLRSDVLSLQAKLTDKQSQLDLEKAMQDNERLSVARVISEKAKAIDLQRVQIEELMNDLEADRKKHQNVVKELHREIVCMRRENERAPSEEKLSGTSSPEQSSATNSTPSPPDDTTLQLSHEVLVRRIVKLQQALARQTEKIDFLENHSASLLLEVQKKTKFIQMCMLNNDFKLPTKMSISSVEKLLNAREKHKS